jgi:hypothetical protein
MICVLIIKKTILNLTTKLSFSKNIIIKFIYMGEYYYDSWEELK